MSQNDELLIVGTYQIYTKDKLGSGGFGKVFKAFNTRSLTTVAVKQISLVNKDAKKIKEIQNEIQLLKQLDHHRIVRYKDDIRKGDYLYIMMEYLESGSLGALTRKFKIDESGISKYIAQVLEGVAFLHAEGIIHRDIKGDNVLLTKDSDVKLADFGVSAKLSHVQANEICGTPFWMAPEIISLSGATYASDIWSIGCMVIELLTGKPPYFDLDRTNAFFRIVMDPHPPLPSSISPACEDFLLQCFHKEPSLRKTAVELLKHPWITQTSLQYPRIIPSSSPSSLGAKANSSRKNILKSESWSSSNFSSFKSDTWETFGNGSSGAYETVLHQKKDEFKISNTDKLKAYLESDSDDDSILDSESYEELQLIDLEKRLDYSSRTFSVGSDGNIFQDDDVDLKINEIKKLEDETAKILRSIISDSNSNDILNLLEQLRKKSEDDFMFPILIRTLLSESMIPLLSLLEYQNPAVVASALKLLLDIQKNDQIKEKLTIIGLFPMLTQVIYSWDLPEIQEDAVSLIYYFIYRNIAYAKLFVASGCFPVIVKLLQNSGFRTQRTIMQIVFRVIDVIIEVFSIGTNLQQRSDLCRLFALRNLPAYLSNILKEMVYVIENDNQLMSNIVESASVAKDDSFSETVIVRKSQSNDSLVIQGYLEKAIDIMVSFSVCATTLIVNKNTIENIVSILGKLNARNKLNALHFIKNISTLTEPSLQEIVIESGVLQALIRELSLVLKEKDVADPEKIPCKICVHILNALFMLCCYSPKRKEIIAKEGAISLLKDILFADLPMKNIALDLFLGFSVSTNAETRHEFMVKQDGPLGLFCILRTMNARAVWPQMVLEALCELLSNNEPTHQQEYERIIAQPDRSIVLIELFTNNSEEQYLWALNMVPSLCNLLQISHVLADAFASNIQFIQTISSWISKEIASAEKTDPRRLKSLLDVLRICLNEKADSFNNIPRHLVPDEAMKAVNDLAEYTQEKKLALFTIVQELRKRIV